MKIQELVRNASYQIVNIVKMNKNVINANKVGFLILIITIFVKQIWNAK